MIKVKEKDKLRFYFGRDPEDRHTYDFIVDWPMMQMGHADASYLLSCVFTKEVRDELARRGYDLTTIKFSIAPKLEWQPMERPYVPTWKDKLRKFFLKKDYPKMVDVRPDDNTIVITKYGDDAHYEIVEYANRHWVTKLSFPVKPSHWAYVPQKVVNLADSIIKQKKGD